LVEAGVGVVAVAVEEGFPVVAGSAGAEGWGHEAGCAEPVVAVAFLEGSGGADDSGDAGHGIVEGVKPFGAAMPQDEAVNIRDLLQSDVCF
jgi:hypothetical protein